jgi:Serine/threonine protein kinase
MTVAAGSRLGPYEVLSPLGAGGMGEVWKARDTRLERTVAVKVLPAHLSSSSEVQQRFEREAKTISSLSHPHICALYDVGNQDGVEYLVMEYLEGETLADRLLKGPLPTEQTLRFGIEIADALDKAHRQGVVHRDLKPGNVMLTKSGVKLLDFGLAKVLLPSPGGKGGAREGLTSLPTMASSPLTQEGTILGTFQYMAPEQLEGKEADVRSDIFAFGAVLYEMATGRKAFSGASQASLISAIMKEEPAPIATLQPMTPPALDRVVRTCLAKDPEDRFQTAHDAKLQLQWIAEVGSAAGVPAPVIARRKNRERLAWTGFAIAALAAALFAAGYLRRAPRPQRGIRATLPFPEKQFLGELALSPDGNRLAFTAGKVGMEPALWVRDLDGSSAQPVAGAENAYFPFWSPDSRSVGFFAGGKLKRVDASGGAVLTVCDAERGVGGTWNRDGTIVFAPAPTSALYRVAAGGGKPVPVSKLDASRHETAHRYPQFLPDGRHFLYMAGNLRRRHGRSGERNPGRVSRRARRQDPRQDAVERRLRLGLPALRPRRDPAGAALRHVEARGPGRAGSGRSENRDFHLAQPLALFGVRERHARRRARLRPALPARLARQEREGDRLDRGAGPVRDAAPLSRRPEDRSGRVRPGSRHRRHLDLQRGRRNGREVRVRSGP